MDWDFIKCRLSGLVMKDPVIVCTTVPPTPLVFGDSYDRSALERWMQENGEPDVQFVSNTCLKGLTDHYWNEHDTYDGFIPYCFVSGERTLPKKK